MGTGRVLASAALVTGVSICSVLAGQAHPTAQRLEGRNRSMYVSVVDQSGNPVPDLGTSDFVVKEDNVAREVLRVAPADDPMQIAVLVDTSQASRDVFAQMREALPPFVTTLTTPNAAGRTNQIAIVGIGERPTILSEYSTNPRDIEKGVSRIWALQGSGMYLLDAIMEVCQGLKKREAVRPVIVAIATEGADFSNRQHDQAIEPMKDAGAAFYAMMIGLPDASLSIEARERAMVLDEGPRATGGYLEQLPSVLGLKSRLTVLAKQLTHEYKVTYARPESLIPPERIRVAAANPALTARGTPVKEQQARP